MNKFIRGYGKYIVILFLIIVSGNVLLYFTYQHLKKEMIDGLNARQMIHAKQAGKGIEIFFGDHINILQSFSKNEHIIAFDDAGKRLMQEFLLSHAGEISIIARMDTRGRILHSEPYDRKVIGQPVSKMEDFLKVKSANQITVSDVFTNKRGFKSIIVHAPVTKNGHFDGTLALLLSFDFITKRYIEDIRIGKDGYAWMVSRNGIELCCPIPGHAGNSVFDNCREFPDILAMAKRMTRGEQGVAVYMFDRIRGNAVSKATKHAVFMPIHIGNNFWSIVIATPEDEVTGALSEFRSRLLLIAILLLIGIGFFFYMLIKTSISVKEADTRRKSVEVLQASEEKYRNLVENINEVIFTLDSGGQVTYISPVIEKFSSYKASDLIGKNFLEFVHPDDLPGLMESYNRIVQGELDPSEYRILDGDKVRHVRSSSQLILKDGVFAGLNGAMTDISERKQAEAEKAELENQNRQLQKSESLGRMAAAIAHHFNNKLGAVIGNLELALMDVKKGAEPQAHLSAAMESSNKAAVMSRQMITYLGQSFDKRELLDLSDTCLRNLPLLQAVMPGNVVLNTDLPSSGPGIKANANQIQQVLTNLITNAQEAAEEGGGAISLSVNKVSAAEISAKNRFPIDWQQRDNAYACLEVADKGCGIAANDIEKIFDPFYSTKFTGRGMGLAVVLGIVKTHTGVLTVESKPKQGSTFRVFFPLSEEILRQHQKAVGKDDPLISAPSPGKMEEGGIALVVEDEEMLRDMAATMMENFGFTVLKAKDGIEALEVFGKHQSEIKFVLTDLTMPRMNGWETLTALRKLSPGIPVILASGYDLAHVMEGDHPELPQAFLAKPYNLKSLTDSIRMALGKKKG
jgi:PAS domain S-box-containing protein